MVRLFRAGGSSSAVHDVEIADLNRKRLRRAVGEQKRRRVEKK